MTTNHSNPDSFIPGNSAFRSRNTEEATFFNGKEQLPVDLTHQELQLCVHDSQIIPPLHSSQEISDNQAPEVIPVFDPAVYQGLPGFLRRILAKETMDEERDLMLLASLATLSGCFPKVHGIYDGRKVGPNLFLFLTAPASAGKGRMALCKHLVKPIHESLREMARQLKEEYEKELAEYKACKGKDTDAAKPARPPEKMFFIPANNSATGIFQLLSDNDGRGLIFETEGDTLSRAFRSDFGNYSDGFRKAFHHETISYYRRTDHEYVDIENPCLSAVLSGTPGQVSGLIDNTENGLFSRFIFYNMTLNSTWKNVFAADSAHSLDDYFGKLGREFFGFYNSMKNGNEIMFELTPRQQEAFNSFFTGLQQHYLLVEGTDYMATIRRLGLIAFRVAMLFTVLRLMETQDRPSVLTCSDEDFAAALSIIRVLARHAAEVFAGLDTVKPLPRLKNRKEKFLEALPEGIEFTCGEAVKIAEKLGIKRRTVNKYLGQLEGTFLEQPAYGHYIKNAFVPSMPSVPSSGKQLQ